MPLFPSNESSEDKNAESNESAVAPVQAPVFGVDAKLDAMRKHIKKASASTKKRAAPKKASAKKKPSRSASKSLESIDFSYSKKLRSLSSSVKRQKAMSQFDDMEEHIVKSNITMRKTGLELSELSKLISSFKRKKEPTTSTTKKTSVQKTSAKKKSTKK